VKDAQFAGGSDFENHSAGGVGVGGASVPAPLSSSVEIAIKAPNQSPNEVTAAAGRGN
jgi:hypothetical protein